MAERYLKIMDKQNETSRNIYHNNSEQNEENIKETYKAYVKEIYNKKTTDDDIHRVNKYYKSIYCYYIGFIEYDIYKLDVYCNIPLKHIHYTLKF